MSVGVVTPFSAQARSIQSRLEQRVSAEERARVSMAVGTAHRFQGDERDVIVFSPVASGGLMPQTLDWLSGTPNLFNVAITRARSYLLVVRIPAWKCLGDPDGVVREIQSALVKRSSAP